MSAQVSDLKKIKNQKNYPSQSMGRVQMPFDHRSDSVWGTDYIANPFFLN